MSIHLLIESLKEKGHEVYGPEPLSTYVFFTDDVRIGYAQCSTRRGVSYATVHVPNRYTGTGFGAQDAQEALGFAPHWAYRSDLDSVVKYKDFEHFRRKHWQPLVKL